ncbi:MAG TPA: Dabb family protein [Bacteroidales bacterium]|nr:Dabb family protein [Bacteroidales bacterium]
MIKHMVMWTIREGDTPRSKFEKMAEMKSRLLNLKEEIREIRSMEVLFNSPLAPQDNYDIVLVCEFSSWAELESYQMHPEHQKVVEYVKNVRKDRACIDIEY